MVQWSYFFWWAGLEGTVCPTCRLDLDWNSCDFGKYAVQNWGSITSFSINNDKGIMSQLKKIKNFINSPRIKIIPNSCIQLLMGIEDLICAEYIPICVISCVLHVLSQIILTTLVWIRFSFFSWKNWELGISNQPKATELIRGGAGILALL